MSDFISDMKDATELWKKWSESHAILDDDFRIIDADLQKHYDNRNLSFEILLKILEQPDESLLDNWQRVCDQALDLLDHLNGGIPSRAADGLAGIGLRDFYEGEMKIWKLCRTGTPATMAGLITQIGKADADLTRQLQDDLKNAKSEGAALDEMTRQAYGTTPEKVRDFTLYVTQQGAVKVISMIPLIGQTLKPYATKLGDELRKTVAVMGDVKTRKASFKKTLLENRKKIEAVKEKMDEGWIHQMVQNACEFADSLRGAGSSGDYRATDWETFAKEVRERMQDRSEPVIEKSKNLFENVHDAYLEGLSGAFVSIAASKDTMGQYKEMFEGQTEIMFEEFKKDQEVLEALHGPMKDQALADLKQVQDEVTARINELKEAIDSYDKEYASLN